MKIANIALGISFAIVYIVNDCNCASLDSSVKDWELLFRGVANTGRQMYSAYNNAVSPSSCSLSNGCIPQKTKATLNTRPRNRHLKSILIDKWICLDVQWVKLEVYKNRSRVSYFIYNGTQSSRYNWMHSDRFVESSYDDLYEDACFTYYSMSGSYERNFNVGTKNDPANSYCLAKRGWLQVIDTSPSYTYLQRCDWTKAEFRGSSLYPIILYAKGSKNTEWRKREFGKANMIAIYISRRNKNF